MSNGRGNQIAIRHFWLSQFKEEYLRRDLTRDELIEERDDMDDYTPDSSEQAGEMEVRIQAINELLDHHDRYQQ